MFATDAAQSSATPSDIAVLTPSGAFESGGSNCIRFLG
jgi:hypothetical protein